MYTINLFKIPNPKKWADANLSYRAAGLARRPIRISRSRAFLVETGETVDARARCPLVVVSWSRPVGSRVRLLLSSPLLFLSTPLPFETAPSPATDLVPIPPTPPPNPAREQPAACQRFRGCLPPERGRDSGRGVKEGGAAAETRPRRDDALQAASEGAAPETR